jgi:hypothetical protein
MVEGCQQGVEAACVIVPKAPKKVSTQCTLNRESPLIERAKESNGRNWSESEPRGEDSETLRVHAFYL